MHVMRGFALAAGVLGLVALSALPARAAEITPASGEIAAGYSYLKDNTGGTSFPAGWFFSAGAHINEGFAVVGDISGNYKSETASAGGVTVTGSAKVHTFLAGPRMMGRAGPLAFYGQFLVGAATVSAGVNATGVGPSLNVSASDTQFCFAPGAGVDVPVTSAAALRVGMNSRLIRSNATASSGVTSGSWATEVQVQVGLVVRFGQ